MSAIDPVNRGLGIRRTFRAVGPGDPSGNDLPETRSGSRVESLRCSFRAADADFYCWKYGVWYNVMDCCYRHERRTYSGCAGCGQGRNNLRANRREYEALGLHRGRPFCR
jgi:hypothetical protein